MVFWRICAYYENLDTSTILQGQEEQNHQMHQ